MENKGFTLIELLIVIAIIGILVGIGLPSYLAHILKANRIDAQLAMNEIALVAERQYSRKSTYPTDVNATGIEVPSSYGFTLATSTSPGGADQFTITATPLDGQNSEECGEMTLNQAGIVTSNNNSNCW